jgi:hypothetical protein
MDVAGTCPRQPELVVPSSLSHSPRSRFLIRACCLVIAGLPYVPAMAQVDYLYGSGFEDDATVQLAALRAAADGAVAVGVSGATVTYGKPAVGNDPAGFFVQGGPGGPALFVRIDPATLTPVPVAGDRVSFTAATMATAQGRRELTALSGWTRQAAGQPLAPLVQMATQAADLVSNLGSYESELVTVTGTLATGLAAAGSGFQSSRLDTAGISGNANLVLRVPVSLVDAADLVSTCTLTASRVPMWRFNAQAQVSPFVTSDLSGFDCPAPRVLAAFPLSSTVLRVNFDRRIDPATVTSGAFAVSGGLVASAASTNGRSVDIVTSMQTAAASYTVTVAPSVRDLAGKSVAAGFASASFAGYVGAATLRIEEINANINGNRDLLEIRALSGGSVAGVQVVQDPGTAGAGTLLAELPGIIVAAGERIVVHFAPIGETDETTSQTQCTDIACYASAWDVRGSAAGILFSNRVIALRAPTSGALLDVVAAGRSDLGTPTAAFPANLQFAQAAGQWLPADCGGAPCTYTSTPTALAVSADWTTLGTTPSALSLQRSGAASDTNLRTDWILAPASFGSPNP